MNGEYKLYLDMDGVLVDFESGFQVISKGQRSNQVYQQYGPKIIQRYILSVGPEFWANLEWIHGGQELWKEARKLFKSINILSSAGTSDPEKGKTVIEGKKQWLKKNMSEMPESNIFIVYGKHRKQEFATENSILVDDLSDTIRSWNTKGGTGILHKASNYKKTIDELRDVVKPLNLTEIVKRIQH